MTSRDDPTARSAALIALDWGTSSLRAYLLGRDGSVLERHSEPWGILHVPSGDFLAAFDRVTRDWRQRTPTLRTIASGMIGSAHGWVEAPYCNAPAGVDELAGALVVVPHASVLIVPGVAQRGASPDVMRGEETQIVGCLATHPEMAERSLLVLPGTHSKWAHVVDGRVQRFTTFMTGELFDVLRTHSILGRPAREARRLPNDADAAAAFARGVLAARDANGGLARSLFSVRALVLAGQVDAACSLDYLSGLLIGDEVRNGLADGDRPRALIGDPALCARYVAALELFGVEVAPIVADAAPDGLWTIAQHALLIASTDEQAIA